MPLIYETIVTTQGADGATHIAPMGVREHDGLVVLAPFRPSTTLANLTAKRCAVVNLTDDSRIFAGCLTGRREWPTRPAECIEAPVLQAALAHRELRVERIDDDEQRPRFYCRQAHFASHGTFAGFNRAQAAVIEGAILISRLDMLPAEKIDREMEYLAIAIEKTAGERELEAWEWLLQAVQAHRVGRGS